MTDNLPRSLTAFEAQLEDAVRRELGAGAPRARLVRRAGRLGRARRRVVAATSAAGLSVAGASAAIVLLVGTGATAPAYAVSRNTNGTVTVKFLRASAIDTANIHSLNARLAAMGVRAEVRLEMDPSTGRVVNAWVHGRAVTCAALQAVTLTPSEIKHAMTLAVDRSGRISVPDPQRQIAVGMAGGAGPVRQVAGPRTQALQNSGAGNSGAGNSGNSGSAVPPASLPPGAIVHARAFAVRCGSLPPSGAGNSGNPGNSGSGTGNSGNSGSG